MYGTFTLKGQHRTASVPGKPHTGQVVITPNAVIRDTAGDVVMSGAEKVTLDADGAWSITLPCDSPELNPSEGIGYVIGYALHSTSMRQQSFYATADMAGSTLDVSDIVSVAVPAPLSAIVGPQGPAGPAGVDGAQGPQGPQGVAGPQGIKGDPGDAGPVGPKGDTGAQGPQGVQGLKGDTGATGPTGPKGDKGDTGPQGPMALSGFARVPDALISGTVTRDANGAATSAPVVWPDGTPGTYTALVVSTAFPGAVDSYRITYGSPVTATFTQPTVTRDATTGAATTVPAITVA